MPENFIKKQNLKNVLYRGARYWIYEIDSAHPCDVFAQAYPLLVYDTVDRYIAAGCNYDLSGELNLGSFPESVLVSGSSYRSLIRNIRNELKQFES